MATAREVEQALRSVADRLHADRGSLSELLYGRVRFVAADRDLAWTLIVSAGAVRLDDRDDETDVTVSVASLEQLHELVADPTCMVRLHQEGALELDDESWAPVVNRLLEPPYQVDARQIRVLSRLGGWLRFRH